jgi:hypothetical protein
MSKMLLCKFEFEPLRAESEMEVEGTEIDASALNAKLNMIDQRANHLQLPTVYASSLYPAKSH